MGYIESNLLPDEKIVYKARLHWIIFWKPFALIVLGIVFVFIQPIVAAIVIAIGVFALISPIVDYATSEFGVTNKRVIIKVGFLRRNVRAAAQTCGSDIRRSKRYRPDSWIWLSHTDRDRRRERSVS